MIDLVVLGSIAVVLGFVLAASSSVSYRFIDATSGRNAHALNRLGLQLPLRYYRWQRPVLRRLWPVFLVGIGALFILAGLGVT